MKTNDLRVVEVARVAECHVNTVRRYHEKGVIAASRDHNGHRRFDLSEALKLKKLLNTRVSENTQFAAQG